MRLIRIIALMLIVVILGVGGCSALVDGIPTNVDQNSGSSDGVNDSSDNYGVPSDSGGGDNNTPPGSWEPGPAA